MADDAPPPGGSTRPSDNEQAPDTGSSTGQGAHLAPASGTAQRPGARMGAGPLDGDTSLGRAPDGESLPDITVVAAQRPEAPGGRQKAPRAPTSPPAGSPASSAAGPPASAARQRPAAVAQDASASSSAPGPAAARASSRPTVRAERTAAEGGANGGALPLEISGVSGPPTRDMGRAAPASRGQASQEVTGRSAGLASRPAATAAGTVDTRVGGAPPAAGSVAASPAPPSPSPSPSKGAPAAAPADAAPLPEPGARILRLLRRLAGLLLLGAAATGLAVSGYRRHQAHLLEAAQAQTFAAFRRGVTAFIAHRWGPAEEAFHQALEIDPAHRLATTYLAALPEERAAEQGLEDARAAAGRGDFAAALAAAAGARESTSRAGALALIESLRGQLDVTVSQAGAAFAAGQPGLARELLRGVEAAAGTAPRCRLAVGAVCSRRRGARPRLAAAPRRHAGGAGPRHGADPWPAGWGRPRLHRGRRRQRQTVA